MKRFFAWVLALCLVLGTVSIFPAAQESDAVFSDISGHWAKNDILWAYENAIAAGMEGDRFAPRLSLTRAMFVAFLYRTARLVGDSVKAEAAASPFSDASPGQWFYESALWAYENGIVAGVATVGDKAVFAPQQPITREQTAAMLYRYLTATLGCSVGQDGAKSFSDGQSISAYAKEAAAKLSAAGIFVGDENGAFSPQAHTERGAAVSLCRRIYTLLRPEEASAPQLPCVAFSPLTIAVVPTEVSFALGRFSFTAVLPQGFSILIRTPNAADSGMLSLDAADYFAPDGAEHTYDIVKLENSAILFYCDGRRVGVYGRARTPIEHETEQQAEIALVYQNITEAPGQTHVSLDGISVGDACLYRLIDESPLGLHGALTVAGDTLIDRFGKSVVMSGVHLFADSYSPSQTDHQFFTSYEELKWLRDDFGINCIRLGLIPLYFRQDSPETQAQILQNMDFFLENAAKVGLYVILDWHGYEEGPGNTDTEYTWADPRIFADDAAVFFERFSKKFASYENIFYELYNEPSGGKSYPWFSAEEVTERGIPYLRGYADMWNNVLRPYSERMLAIIRANDPDAAVIVNTLEADQHPEIAALYPIDADNVMYAVHPFSDGHMRSVTTQLYLRAKRLGNIAMFATEAGFYPDEANGFYDAGLPNTVENAIYWLHSSQERYFENFVERYDVNYIYFLLARGGDNDYRTMFRRDRLSERQGSGWSEEQMTFTGAYMRHWFRKRAGLEDDSWFRQWHTENDAYYNALIEKQRES